MQALKEKRVQVLFVCLGNICRSPMAKGAFATQVAKAGLSDWIAADSAGLHDQFGGAPPDERAQAVARRHRVDISPHRARRIEHHDFRAFDYILAMDLQNHALLGALCPPGLKSKLHLLLDYAPQLTEREIPDPYYGGQNGFERAFQLAEEGARGLLAHLQRQHFSTPR